ncbi:non-ribosomal peptide synthase/polyketide synthase, partial [Xanthomonas sp. WHRI 7945]|nr:non-ribosomal peptide synthase/polyketide synthase [Xanthomonas campestris pv. campestris]
MKHDAQAGPWMPLSAAQRSRWFLYRLNPDAQGTHNNAFAAAVHGVLAPDQLARALRQLALRHPMLRVRFREQAGEVEQSVAHSADVPLILDDVASLDEAALLQRVRDDAAQAFDLFRQPPVRAGLYRRADETQILLLTFDHIAVDGWSYWRLLEELGGLLGSGAVEWEAPDAEADYEDYVRWQAQWLQGPAAQAQRAYWKDALHGAAQSLQLPADRPLAAASGQLGEIVLTIPLSLSLGLHALGRRHAGTLYTTLLAAYTILLHRYCGQDDISIGSPMPGRSRSEWDGVVGDFVNPIVLRSSLPQDASVADALRTVRNTALRGMKNQDYPFALLVEDLHPLRIAGQHSFYQTMFVFQNARHGGGLRSLWGGMEAGGPVAWGGVGLASYPACRSGANDAIPLLLETIELEEGIRCAFKFDQALFEQQTVERLSRAWLTLLQGLVADDAQLVARLPLLPEAERELVLHGFNATQAEYPEVPIHTLFEAQAAQQPQALALECGDRRLSYGELNARANQLAHRLIALGITPDDRVAICMQRSADMVVGLLGILKAGGAYVPLDPAYPAERLSYMLADSAPVALLTQAALVEMVRALDPAGTALAVVALDDDITLDAQPVHDPSIAELTSRHLAYVIYTSGSTGRPKGVMIEHANAANLLAWAQANFSVEQLATTLLATSINFDLAVFELFVPLSTGRTVRLVADLVSAGPALVGTTLVNTVPSAIAAVLDGNGLPATVTAVNLAGEPLKRALVERVFAASQAQMVANLYGPSETTTYSTWTAMTRAGGFVGHIGRPIANTRVYALGAHGEPVPIGVAGELHIGGAGVARGYLNRADLTAERFLVDPFVDDANARMYRTGDLGRWLPDGNIEYLGRNDFQVKVRGFRIELGEIEARLSECDGVREAAVLAREDAPGEKRLVAYLVAEEGAEPSAVALRDALSQALPEYMLPSAFVILPALPLTPNGKLDRQALPAPDRDAVASRAYAAPEGEAEQAIATIWQDLLGLERVGRHDHFFDLGGHSLLAVRLVTRVRAALGVELALREVFAQPVLAALAKSVSVAVASLHEAIVPVDRAGSLPLSWAQQRLWFLDRLDHAAGAAYHIPAALRLSGGLDRIALQKSLDRVVARHESLRTTFVSVEGEPQQAVAAADSGFALTVHDLHALDAIAQERAVAELSIAEARAPFDLARGPLIRGRLLVLSAQQHVLLVTQHHIVSDGWSIGILVREISALYTAFLQGEADPLPALPVQYADYAAWQRRWLQGTALQEQLAFWKNQLRDAPALLELPTDRPRPMSMSYRGGSLPVRLPAEAVDAVRSLSQRHGTTLFMTLLASWSALLARLSGQDQVVIGSPVANRQRAEVEPLIGFFVNTLALRVDLRADPSVAELLAQVRTTLLDAYAHQDLPFEQVVEAVQPVRSLSHSPVFQAMLSLNNTPSDGGLRLPGLAVAMVETGTPSAQFDLSLSLNETTDGLVGALVYAQDLFEPATVERLLGHWQTLLIAMAADAVQPVSRLPLLSADERKQVLAGFNATEIDYPRHALIHTLFEAQAAQQPQALALECGDQRLSYGELNARANQLAHRLIGLGVTPDDRVAICMQRSADMVVGLLGILKAGGAYVPLDPAYPAERLAYMLADSAPVALLTQVALVETVRGLRPAGAALAVVALDDDAALDAQPVHDPSVAGLTPRHLAYVIYTSGSTGRPKGVMIEHAPVVNLWTELEHSVFGMLCAEERVALNSSLSFDASVQTLTQLLSGRCVVVIPEAVRIDTGALLQFLSRQRIGAFDCTPAQLRLLLDAGLLEGSVASLKAVLVGGEAIAPGMWRTLSQSASIRIFNAYGPTECTVESTIAVVNGAGEFPHIGRPIANARVYILDARAQPVPVGVAGELHIGGTGVGRGYLNRPDLTAERFLSDPFVDDTDARMYRTGDLGRWLPDGSIEYLGRNDFQVKVRGFRIELGEIESALTACAGVGEAVVLAREDVPGEKRLVAYLVAEEGAEPSAVALRDALSQALPEYMLPSAFVILPALPLTPSGKLDRQALPVPDRAAVASRSYAAPEGEAEQAIAAIWRELLGLERVGRNDHFFELGGHSLLAVRLVTRVRAALGVELALREVFAQPVLSSLACAIAAAAATAQSAIVPVDRTGVLPLSWAQQRLWFLDQLDHAAGAAYHMPAALRLSGTLDRAVLQASLDRVVARHESLRTTFANVEGEPQQMIAPVGSGFSLAARDLRELDAVAQEAAIAELSSAEARAPFDLARGPLIRGQLLQLSEREHVLLVTQHHIVSDGWSIGVLVREVSALYAAFRQGTPDPLPALPVQYADYAAWQRRWLQGAALQEQLAFWKSQLGDAPALLALPADRARPAVQSYRGEHIAVCLPQALSEKLYGLSQRHGTTLFMTLLASWSVLLSRLSGQDQVVIGSPVANRQRAEVEPLIGFFVNTLALRVDLSADPSVAELLARVRAMTLGAYANQDLPFEQIVEALQPERSLSHSPIFQTLLTLNNTGSDALSLPGLLLSTMAAAQQTAQFDLALSLAETTDGLVGSLVYAVDLFDHGTVERMLGYWTTLLEAMVENDAQTVARLPLLSGEERAQVLYAFNATQAAYPQDGLIHGAFEAQAQARPDAVAIEFGGEFLNYGELNRRANHVAYRLIALGVEPDDRVAICAERSIEMVIGLLGILKAGGAYVPLDPVYPSERLAYMLSDSAPKAVLTQSALNDRLPLLASMQCPAIALDDCDTLATQASHDPSVSGLTSRHLAYVIYTSGSTGLPKGVMIEHANAANLLAWAQASFTQAQLSTTLLSTSINFDLAVFELFVPLSVGATVRLVRDLVSATPMLAGTTLVNTVPSAIAAVLESSQLPATVRTVNLAGEPLKRTLVDKIFASSQAQSVANLYGPSETTTYSTWVEMARADGFAPHIGRPIANTQIYILDGEGEAVPIGVAGEIHIGGAGVARGYLNRPDLTAERFLADPFAPDTGARMYKTGDLGRWRPDGTIEYLGRNDFQVKIRGFRIELGEVEARLAACANVREAVVVAREDLAGDKRLVAYVVAQDGASAPSIAALREQLAQDLPEYMIPSAFVQLQALPLTPNGKLDRRALPAPDLDAVASRAYEAPVGATEQAIAEAWQELLGLERVGRHDHFFELGGHSLLAVRLVTRLRGALGVDLALRDVFAQPTLSGLARVASSAEASTHGAIVPVDRSAPLPLSWAQQRLWFLDQLDHAAAEAYHIPAALRLTGELHRTALRASLDRIVVRHESLRTIFASADGAPHQVIVSEGIGFALLEHDLRAMEASAQAATLAELSAEEARAPFDLAAGPLIRGRLLQLADDDHVLLVTQHHIVSDGWSIALLIRELGALYAAFSQGEADPLAPLPIQYADYAAWQRQWLQGDVLQRQIAFWREHLAGAPALLELPSDRPRPATQSYRGDAVEVRLGQELTGALHALSQRHGVTLFMTLLAGWSALLSRMSGQDEVVIGSPIANRQRAEVEPMVGFFVNTLALRVKLDADPSVAELLAQIKATTLGAYAHQDLPFEQVVEALQPARSLSHSPLFQALLALNNTSADALRLPGLMLSTIDVAQRTTQFDLTLSLVETADGLVGSLAYAVDLFDQVTVQRMFGHWTTLLEAMVTDDAQSLSRLSLLSLGERQRILAGFNATRVEHPHDKTIHALFEAQAARHPDAVAVECGDGRLSYGELNHRANRLAHHLAALGVRCDERIALCMERGIEMVVGVLGILKAGAAYVPLDPDYPPERLAFMLSDSAPVALLTDTVHAERLSVLNPPRMVVLDGADDRSAIAKYPQHDPQVKELAPHHLAYVIYTSGSTGRPKGVMVEHRQLVASTLARTHAYSKYERFLLLSSIAFDSSVAGIFGTLASAGTLLIPEEVSARDLDAIAALVERLQATTLLCVPSLARLILEHLSRHTERSLREIIVAGETCPPALRDMAASFVPTLTLYNEYGPTEATVWATLYRASAGDGGPVPIGRPVANTRIYVLDRHGALLPVGVAGELHIGGAGVARGYLGRPDLTAERFLADPFSNDADARMYRTGDMGRWLADGNLQYLGRNDFQVKIRGFRVELGEIEAKLSACAGVREAAVIVREDVADDRRLVAYVVAQPGMAPSAAELRMQLSQDLPEYMIPSAFVGLDALPLTPNGKLDRKALPAPDQSAIASRDYQAPVGDSEQMLAGLWQELLGLKQIGRADHFFELGGHSLLAVRLVARLRAMLGIDVPLRDVFARPILSELAQLVSGATVSSQAAIVPVQRDMALPLSWAQQRLWFLDQLDDGAGAAYHIPTALRLSGVLDQAALQASLDRVVARHESLRTTFVSVDGEPRQTIAPADSGFALTRHDLRELEIVAQAIAVAELSESEARAHFDLACGPLIRGRLLQLAEREHLLLVTQHHIVSDGWSIGVLVREVSALYAAFSQGHADPLPALQLQYADYAAWQRQWLQGDALQTQIGFWRDHLRGVPTLLELPTDRPRPALQRYIGDRAQVRVPEALTAALRTLSARHGATLFMTLLAGWSTLLSRLSGQHDVVIGTPVANRQRAEIEPLIGFFVNTLALRVDLSSAPSVAELLAQIKSTTLGAYAHQDLPFEQVVEILQPERSLSHSPVFQVLLALNNVPAGEAATLPDLALSVVDAAQQTAQFDLALSLTETAEGLVGGLTYAVDLFDRGTVERMLDCWKTLLEAMVAGENQSVARLPLLSASARAQVLTAFNATQSAYPSHETIHAQFEAQAARNPDVIAVEFDGEQLSYGELNRRANRLAHRLMLLGVEPDARVAICVERSLEMVVGVLGTLKAGAAYVPLDPAYPNERLAYVLEDCAPVAVLTQTALRERLLSLHLASSSATWLTLDDAAVLAGQPDHDPCPQGLASDHLAYVIYTSGSTGRPKGVAMPHRALRNLLEWQGLQRSEVVEHERVLQFSALGFDVAFQEMFYTLGSGGCLILVNEAIRQDPFGLIGFIQAHAVQRIFLPFVALQGLAAAVEHAQVALPSLRDVVTAGEQLFANPVVKAFFATNPACRLHNQYGPTETHVVTALTLSGAPEQWPALPPIGRPIANTQIYILDGAGEAVPIGVAGEIHIGGAGVARGYLNRPDLTAERFLADPFAPDTGARMYKTGDLGRWRPDGTIEYLGRNDFQVKIRGFRIELGEVEARLAACASVREAVVVAREDLAGDKRLVAYVVAQDGDSAPSIAALREQLAQDLPEYMIPSAFVHLQALPLTPNGKLDRKALPAPDLDAVASRAYEAPVGATEQAIAEVWQELLGLERVGRHDHFFELGGHSLLAVRLVTRLRGALGVDLALRDVFAQPTLSGLARVASSAEAPTHGAIESVDRSAPLPLSWAQQRLWFLDQLDHAAAAAYHIPAALRLSGKLHRAALCASLDRIVARHESLRTIFASADGQPHQVIVSEDIGFALLEHDLRAMPASAQAATLAELSAEEAHAPFDLAAGPLIRGRLLQLADDDHVLLVTQHHIVSDGWSIAVLIRELGALYAAFSQGEADPLAPLPIQYADYAAWQRQWLQGDVLQRQIGFWRDHLAGAPALLELPTDRPRPATQSYRGDAVEVRLGQELTAALHALSQRHGVTLFMTLLAGWSALLSRLSGQDEVVIGSPIANRQRAEVEPMVGFFVNTLALRVKLDADPSVAELLAQIKATTLGAYAHQDLPFEQVVEALQPARSLSHSPLFQASLDLQNTPQGELRMSGLMLAMQETPSPTSQFDLTLSLTELDGALCGVLKYATDLFDRARIERLAGHFEFLLRALASDPAQRVSALPLLSDAERHQLLVAFNATDADYPRDACIHALFEAQVRERPDAVAVAFEGERLSYDELNRRANRLAHRLIALGVAPGNRVAICAERNSAMVIGVLGILKAGGAYVPLDPAYPADRLAFMLDDSAPVALLAQSNLSGLAAASHANGAALPVILLDREETPAEHPTYDPVVPGLTSHHLAYVIYTSGTTGQPKGVMVEHRSLVNYVVDAMRLFGIVPGDMVLQQNSLNFDISVEEMLPALCGGAALAPTSRIFGSDDEAALPLTFVHITAAHWHTLVTQWQRDPGRAQRQLQGLRLINVTGDALSTQKLQVWDALRPPALKLINTYGPTETTVSCTAAYVRYDEFNQAMASATIGRPLANTRIYILDAHLQPVPLGVAGEIYIGGDGVTRGYLNRPQLTAERFLRDPFSANPTARLYRSGDRARYREDGNIEYLGRNDFQVKIRGFRVEPGEIEARLAACAGVREAVVIARVGPAGDRRLLAYVVPHDGAAVPVAALREELLQDLPDYMVPSAFVRLDALPLTPNGKLDRKALPEPDQAALASREYEAPVGDAESAVAEVWQALLGVERVGRQDHFFELGGHSLLVIGLIEQLRRRGFGTDVRTVFMAPTLSGMTARLSGAVPARRTDVPANPITQATTRITPELLPLARLTQDEIDAFVAAVPGGVGNIQDAYPLAPLQQGILFHHLLERETGGDTYLLCTVAEFDERAQLDAFLAALQRVIDRHDILRSAVHWEGLSKPVQVVQRRASLPVHELALSADTPALAQLLAHTDPGRIRVDLRRAPLLAAHVVRDPATGRWLLALLNHHMVCDHIAQDLILAEIQTLLEGREDALPPPMPYRDFIARTMAVPEAEHEAYFRERLGDVDEPTAPFGVLNVQADSGGKVEEGRLRLDDALAKRIRDSARREGVTSSVLFHVAWAQVLAQCSGRDDVVFGTVLSGRLQETESTEHVVGMFINTLPIRIRLAEASVVDTVRETYRQLGALLSHEQSPLALAQRCSGIQVPLPLFTALFNYRHNLDDAGTVAPAWDGMRVISDEVRTNYPLTMSVDDFGQAFALVVQCGAGIDPERMVGYLAKAIEGLVDALEASPALPVRSVTALPAFERQQMLFAFNATDTAYPHLATIHGLFEAQAARQPDADALEYAGDRLSYAALNRRANAVAHRLIAMGVTPGDRVAICAERSLAMVVGVLGVLKAGAAYVPLDPAYPADRLAYMLADSAPMAVLTQAALRARLPMLDGLDVPAIVLDAEVDDAVLDAPNPVVPNLTSREVAYVIYTSGSTGQPKGVMVEHRSAVNFWQAMTRTTHRSCGPNARVAL